METLQFTVFINASAENVWLCLWKQDSYKTWTKPFHDGSYYQTTGFKEGNTIHFLTPGGDGMYSVFSRIIENSFLAFKHLGGIKNFKEIPVSVEDESWSGGIETYTLNETESGTELIIHVDTIESYIDFMNDTFPLALRELKRMAESEEKSTHKT